MKHRFTYIHHFLFVVLALWICSVPVMAQKKAAQKAAKKQAFTVVIDAGHGGHDCGALGKKAQEKSLNLDVSLMLGQMITERYPDVNVLYTRKTDVFLTLQERANFVNNNAADLFICIHTNSAKNHSASGAETFVLGVDKMQSNLDVAMRENAVMLLENDQSQYEGFDPNSIDSYIMFELMQNQYIDQSLRFATLVQNEFVTKLGRADRGVRQAGFWVLHKSACPSVLIEMGFISNEEEEKYLSSAKGKQDIARAILRAFAAYKARTMAAGANATTDLFEETESVTSQPAKDAKVDSEEAKSGKTESKDAKSGKTDTKDAKSATSETKVETKHANENEGLYYAVQIFASSRIIPANDATFKGLKDCQYTLDGKFYKYRYGHMATFAEAEKKMQELKALFPDCFVVAFDGDEQIFVKDAKKRTNE
ncbi:MAG: N-acetylmuramoyl-L-alanine amidase [Paludibacteraceae bacterium]|nr:N-acetylmuramoyl-L-alanine amidase [Paludibacteraceae bacterium]